MEDATAAHDITSFSHYHYHNHQLSCDYDKSNICLIATLQPLSNIVLSFIYITWSGAS